MSIEKLKEALKLKKAIIGADRTLKELRNGKISQVFLTKNCPDDLKKEIKSFGVEVHEMSETSDEIALICKRQHPIAVIGCAR